MHVTDIFFIDTVNLKIINPDIIKIQNKSTQQKIPSGTPLPLPEKFWLNPRNRFSFGGLGGCKLINEGSQTYY